MNSQTKIERQSTNDMVISMLLESLDLEPGASIEGMSLSMRRVLFRTLSSIFVNHDNEFISGVDSSLESCKTVDDVLDLVYSAYVL